ncbi:hypothetical protein CONLIGDRAFT_639953 [Coniochaeta ligniaria NRRL 30616]|uniref:Uncharacterized protein n=1 Tax=Coniochaeta ligniaria NRRL 30616 TaxID=1408157 RepID=A0A1J7J6C1_9PEZI|nr:hypothetical protein CONLIGDRAFT_639953 [Coniochaeta ligniaria NRRL 30616]
MIEQLPRFGGLLVLSLSLAAVNGLLQCPETPGWRVIDQDGGSGGRWKIPGDFIMHKTPLGGGTSTKNGQSTHVAVNFTLTSAFDHVNLACYGETTTSTAGAFTPDNTGAGYVNGTCSYPGSLMGAVDTSFQYNLDYTQADLYIYQDFTCNRTTKGRPWRVHADCITKQIDLSCDDTGLVCDSPYPYDMGVYYVPLFPPPPLTNCSAGVLEKSVPFIISNISYNSVQSSESAPVLGAAYVEMSMPLIDFTMRCLPSGDEMAWTWNGTSETWYDCKADFTNPIDMPATWIKFNHTTFEVTVLQEFTCDDSASPEYVTAQGTTTVPRECADTYNGMDCWSTRVATITATNVTEQAKPPLPHSMLAHAQTARTYHQLTPQIIELLVKQNVLKKDLLKPSTTG